MNTLLEILNKSADYFKSKGIENYRLDAQLILGHVLGLKRIDLYVNFDRPLKNEEVSRCRELVKRRGLREPLQHILGETPFRHLMLVSDKRALVPRKETELIVDLTLKWIENHNCGPSPFILDLGTGTGAIALSLIKELPDARVVGSDISADCIELAQENANKNSIEGKGQFLTSDFFENITQDKPFELILSNPPYIAESEYQNLPPEVRDWDPKTALVGGPKGTEIPAKIIEESIEHLSEGGCLIMEIGRDQSGALSELGLKSGWKKVESHRDYANIPRFLVFQK